MCTDHSRAGVAIAPSIHRIPLRPSARRWSRRSLLMNAGIGTAGVAILAACSGSDSASSGPEESATAATSESTEPPGTEAPSTSSSAASGATLELTWVELGFVSAYVLVRGREAAIVDTGVEGSGPAITEALATVGLAPVDVRHIVLTHNHGDHVGGLGELAAEMTNATVSAGPGDVDTIQTSLSLQEVRDGDEVFGMGVVHTPGHTPGSIAVFDTETGLLVAGDTINGDGTGGLLGPNDRFTADMTAANASLAKMADLAPSTAAFGHGGGPVDVDVAAKLAALAG